jgi:hypothetical protein
LQKIGAAVYGAGAGATPGGDGTANGAGPNPQQDGAGEKAEEGTVEGEFREV